MSRAWCIVLIIIAQASWVGSAPAAEPEEPQKAVGPWWVAARSGGYTFQSSYGSGVGYLHPVDGPPGGISLGMKEALLVGVGGGRWVNRWLALEASVSRFDVELGGTDLFEETGEGTAVEIGTCALHTAQLTVLFGTEETDDGRQKRLTGFLGLDLLYERPGSFRLAEPGQSRLGIIDVETRSAWVWGISVRGDIRLGRGPWALTMNSLMTLGGSEPFVVRTDPEAGYESSPLSFRPLTITIGVLRRL